MSNISRYVERKDLVIVMPDGANSYYASHSRGVQYHDYIVKDLVKRWGKSQLGILGQTHTNNTWLYVT